MKAPCETKSKLLKTALQLIWESSYGSVSVDDICKQAGVNKGSFYYFFPSKSDLTVAAMEESWQQKRPALDEIFSPQAPPLLRIERFCLAALEGQKQKKTEVGKVCGCPNITLGSELSTQDEKIRLKAAEIINRYLKYFESALRDASSEGCISIKNPSLKAEELFAYFQGVLLLAKVRNDLKPLSTLHQGMLHLLQPREKMALS